MAPLLYRYFIVLSSSVKPFEVKVIGLSIEFHRIDIGSGLLCKRFIAQKHGKNLNGLQNLNTMHIRANSYILAIVKFKIKDTTLIMLE